MGIDLNTQPKPQRVGTVNFTVILHVVFWLLFFGVLMFIDSQTLPIGYALQRNLMIVFFNALVFYMNFLWIMPEYFERGDIRAYSVAMTIMLVIAPTIQYILEYTVFSVPEEIKVFTYNIRYVFWLAIQIAVFIIVSTLLKMAMSRNYFEKELLELRAMRYEAELKFLREQINPHFLFNSINNIYSLSLENSPRTPEMILKLSELLRYMLYDCNQPRVALDSEINCVESLIELFQLKFPEPINITLEKRGKTSQCEIVPNLFTPLIENAFKHGDFASNKKAFIEIVCTVRSSYIYFSVKNSKSPIKESSTKPGGIGLENLKRRFQINYAPSGQLRFREDKNSFQAAMKIPLV